MSRINKTQTYAALWLNSQGWTITKIANELDLTEKQIQNTITKQESSSKNSPAIKTVSEPVAKSSSKNLMISETANKSKNVSIMTKEASMLNDELKKKGYSPVRNNTGIYRPNGNK